MNAPSWGKVTLILSKFGTCTGPLASAVHQLQEDDRLLMMQVISIIHVTGPLALEMMSRSLPTF